ncbi:MAG TPA: alpha/beta fold hydrolase, partial [Bryobacteraceae bacterium]|nr:alpha/beta fold hydrolase [Bryobacteraceae bacterium]
GQVRKLPQDAWPMVQAHWSDPKCFQAIAEQLRALPSCARCLQENSGRIETPLILLSAGDASAMQRAEHEKIVANAVHGRLEVVESSGHWVQLDRPDAVLDAIAKMMAAGSSV